MILFYNKPSLILENSPLPPSVKLDEIDEMASSITDIMNKEVHIPMDVLNSFKLRDNLNPDIWIDGKLNPDISKRLIKIARDFFKDLSLEKTIVIRDIILTGSLANYNWSKYSDIDLHVVLDFSQFNADPQIIEDFFYAQKEIWNIEHNIKIFNYPVELYVQDSTKKLIATAVYSVLRDKWLRKPSKENFQVDKKTIRDKADAFIYQLRDIRQDYEDKKYQQVIDRVHQIKTRIKNMRLSGMESGGELSIENLVFKTLRRTPFMDILDSYKAKSYDNMLSLSERLSESNSPKSIKYKKESYDDGIILRAIYNNKEVGKLSLSIMSNAYWWFEGSFSENEYDELIPSDEFIMLEHIQVIPNFRNMGIAKELMNKALNLSKKLNYDTIILNASPMGSDGLDINNLIKFYESFGFSVILNQGHNAIMMLKLNTSIKESESIQTDARDRVIFIMGKKLEDGTHKLYATSAKKIITVDKKRADNSEGQPNRIVVFGNNQVYRVKLKDNNLIAQGVDWNSTQSMLDKLALSTTSVSINGNNKTPLHWESLKYTSIPKAISMLSQEIRSLGRVNLQ